MPFMCALKINRSRAQNNKLSKGLNNAAAQGGEGNAVSRVIKPKKDAAIGGTTKTERDTKLFAHESDKARQKGDDGGATAHLETETEFDKCAPLP